MDTEIAGEISTNTTVTATPGRDVQVMVDNFEGTATSFHTPAQARELAAALIRAAEEAEDAVVPDEFDESQCGDECRSVIGLCDHYESWYRASMRKAWRGMRDGLEGVMSTLEDGR